jgi:hypothetical protein
MKGNDDKPKGRSGKSDPKAKNLEKKGAPPPDKPAITIDEPNTLKSYTTERPALIEDNVQTSASDGGDHDLPPRVTSTPMPGGRQILAPATPDQGGEAETSRLDDKDTLINIGNLQVPGKTTSEIRKRTKTDKGPAARTIASNASTQGSKERTKRTRGNSKAIAKGKALELRVSRKQGKKNAPGSGIGRGQGAEDRRGSIVVTEVNKLNCQEAKAAKLAAERAELANASQSKHIDKQRYIALQADKSGHIVPEVLDQGPPGDSDSSDPGINGDSNRETDKESRID